MTLDNSGNFMVGGTGGESKANVFSGGSNGFSSGTLPPGLTIYGASTDGYGSMLSFKPNTGAQGVAGIGSFRVSGYQTDLRFYTNSANNGNAFAEAMRIDSSGNLLVGNTTTDAGVRLKVVGGIIKCVDVYNNTTASAANVQIDSNGNFARSTSSLKYKTDVQNAIHGLTDLLKLRSVTYKGKTNGEIVFGGLIAEEVHDAGLTEFVQYAPDGSPDALAYGNMVSLCIKAIQELSAKVTALEAKLGG
jgi:hypothetical protein